MSGSVDVRWRSQRRHLCDDADQIVRLLAGTHAPTHAGQICMASSRVIAEKEIALPLAEARAHTHNWNVDFGEI